MGLVTYVVDGGLRLFLHWACRGGANSTGKMSSVGFGLILSGLCEELFIGLFAHRGEKDISEGELVL